MRIDYFDDKEEQHQIMYYIKTHQSGSLRSGGSTTTPVDIKELFVYKVLEHSGYGPKAHFFFNHLSPGAFFIATQDESFTKVTGKEEFFQTYDHARDDLEKLSKQELSNETKKGIACADLFLKIFNLWDIITNPGNYGCTTVDQKREKWRIIDFRVETIDTYYLEQIFEDFRDGERMVGYLGLPNSILKETDQAERIKLASLLVEEFELGRPCQSHAGRQIPLLKAMSIAYDDVKSYIIEHHDTLRLDVDSVLLDLDRYFKDIQINFGEFAQKTKEHAALTIRDISIDETPLSLRPRC